jgi:hypothetical protein
MTMDLNPTERMNVEWAAEVFARTITKDLNNTTSGNPSVLTNRLADTGEWVAIVGTALHDGKVIDAIVLHGVFVGKDKEELNFKIQNTLSKLQMEINNGTFTAYEVPPLTEQ